MLTGGRSTRMGRDKAIVEVDGRALATIAADALRDAGATDVVAVGGDRVALEALGLRVLDDLSPGAGPLGGIVTALDAASEDVVVVLACDLPWVTPEAVVAVVDGLGTSNVAVPVVAGRPQQLLGAWRRSTALDSLRSAFSEGERAIWRAMASLRVTHVTLRDDAWAHDADVSEGLFPPVVDG